MPHPSQSLGASFRSENPPSGQDFGKNSPQFTESKQSSSGTSRGKGPPGRNSSEKSPFKDQVQQDLKATEPFPPGLFRVPVPNRVFGQMAGLSDAALRCLLALIHKSWRFDPEESSWTHTEEWLTRAGVEGECGLSGQGTRQGLSDLESEEEPAGLVEIDRSGRSYRYKLALEVPRRRFTYLPTSMLEEAPGFTSATALRVLLAVFRETWGWTQVEGEGSREAGQAAHRRWAELSIAHLSRLTGHSETAISQATQALEGNWIGRARPGQAPFSGSGALFYRIRAEAFGPEPSEPELNGHKPTGLEASESESSPENKSPEKKTAPAGKNGDAEAPNRPPNRPSNGPPSEPCGGQPDGQTSNTVAPHRQHSCPPSSYRESSFREQNKEDSSEKRPPECESASPSDQEEKSAVLEGPKSSMSAPEPTGEPSSEENSPGGDPSSASEREIEGRGAAEKSDRHGSKPEKSGNDPDFSQLTSRKQELARKLVNAGVWPRRTRECLQRYSPARVEANFELWRRRKNDLEAPRVANDGAFLCEAITEGYASLQKGSAQEPSEKQEPFGEGGNPDAKKDSGPQRSAQSSTQGRVRVPKPTHKQKISPREKSHLIEACPGVKPEHFHRFRHRESRTEKQFLYFEEGSPSPRGRPRAANSSEDV